MITSIKQNLEINMPKIQVKILINLFELKFKFYFFKQSTGKKNKKLTHDLFVNEFNLF